MKTFYAVLVFNAVLCAQEPITGGRSIPATANSTGVTANLLAAEDTNNPVQYQTAAPNSCNFAGIALSTATSGPFYLGVVPGLLYQGVAGNPITAGHLLVPGATGGRVYDSGKTDPSTVTGTCIIGKALANAAAGTTIWLRYGGASGGGGSSNAADILRFTICVAAGCGMETTLNYIAMNTSGTFTECFANLATAPTGSTVTIDVQNGSGVSIFGGTKLNLTVANGTAVVFQNVFANSPQTFARGDKFKAVVTAIDSGMAAQGGAVQCR
jgi:hypothetical protein